MSSHERGNVAELVERKPTLAGTVVGRSSTIEVSETSITCSSSSHAMSNVAFANMFAKNSQRSERSVLWTRKRTSLDRRSHDDKLAVGP